MSTGAGPTAVVMGLSPTGLYVARELCAGGIRVLGVDREFGTCSASSALRRSGGAWHESDPDKLLQKLVAFAHSQAGRPVLFPTSDYFIEFICQRFSDLSDHFSIAPDYHSLAAQLLDKLSFYRLCRQHAVAVPGLWELKDAGDIDKIIDELMFPCILKPTLIHLAKDYLKGAKVLVVANVDELLDRFRSIPAATGSWLLQEIIPGEESNITLLAGYRGGNEHADDVLTARKVRQYPPGFGSASRVVSEDCEETIAITKAFLGAVGYRGLYGAEYKRDPRDGQLKIIEINPRPTLWFQISHDARKRLAYRAYCDLTERPLPPTVPQLNGVLWRYGLKDFSSMLFYKRHAGAFLLPPPRLNTGPAKIASSWPVFSMTDPLPFIAELWVYVKKLLRRAL
ncbi:MAG: hypothetical protein AAGA91_09760 [Pseudomonadota bacterium]